MAQNNFVDFDQAKALANKVAQRLNEQSAGLIFKGSKTFATLPSTLTQAMAGYVYNMSESFTTDSRFVEGSGKTYPAGTNVAVADCSTYEAVADPSGDPSSQDWYELVNNKYVLSTDTEVDPSKTYYVGTISMKFDVASGFIDVESINDRIDDVRDDVAEQFSTSGTYKAGDIVMHNDLLYKFKTNHSAGAWNSAEVDATNIASELSENQNVLTAGDHITIDDGEIAVNRYAIPAGDIVYKVLTGDYNSGNTVYVDKYESNGTFIERVTASPSGYQSQDVDGFIHIYKEWNRWEITLLEDCKEQSAGYNYSVAPHNAVTENDFTFTVEQQLDNNDLVIRGELATKQDALTFDDVPTTNSNNPVKSGGVKSAIDAAVSSAYHHAGTKTCAELVAGLLVAGNEGNVYNMTDSGTTTADFIEGAGQPIKAGDNVGIAKISDGVYKFDLLSGFVDTTNFVQKSVTAGLLKNDGTVDTTIQGDVSTLKSGLTTLDTEVNGDATVYPYADVITIEDAIPANVADCKVKIEPVQDLHGQSAPYVGGAGKNKLPLTVDGIKALNVYGTWSGNAYAYNGVTFTILTDNDGNVTGVSATGTASDSTNFIVAASSTTGIVDLLNGKSLIYNGCPSGGSEETYSLYGYHVTTSGGSVRDTGNGVTFDGIYSGSFNFSISVASGYTIPTGGLIFYPMIRLATETDATFAPYTNICPISGHTEVDVQRDGNDKWTGNDTYTTTASDFIIPNTNCALPAGSYKMHFDMTNPVGGFELRIFKNNSTDWQNRLFVESFHSATHNVVDITINESATNLTLYNNNPSGATISNVRLYSTTQTYTIALGDTIYGGTVDFDSGVMTVTRVKTTVDDLEWTKYNVDQGTLFRGALSNIKQVADGYELTSAISSAYPAVANNDRTDKTLSQGPGISAVDIIDDDYADAASFKTAMSDVEICYELATPTTIQLTPQKIQLLKGQNTLTASTGQISVTVNGVSGAIGAVQEQVNELADSVVDRFDNVIGWSENKNLIPLTLKDIKKSTVGGTWNGNKYTIDGVEYEVIIDAKGCVSKIRANGTPTNSSATFLIMNKPSINPGTAIISTGTDAKGSSTTYDVTTLDGAWGNQQNVYDSKTVTAGISKIQLKVYAGYTAENLDFRPMVRNASISDPTYEPYHELIGKSVNGLLDRVPDAPTTDGTYNLQVTVSSGMPTYSWVSAT